MQKPWTPRVEAHFRELVHPVVMAGRVFAWAVLAAETSWFTGPSSDGNGSQQRRQPTVGIDRWRQRTTLA